MKTTTRMLCAACVGAALMTSVSTSVYAACTAGDLAGRWTMYGILVGTVGGQPANLVQVCAVTLANASSNPITYSITGTCRGYTFNQGSVEQITGGTVNESRSCVVKGSFILDSQPVQIIHGQIENQTRKGNININGIGRADVGGGNGFVMQFNLTR